MNEYKVGDRVRLTNIIGKFGAYTKSKANTVGNVGTVIKANRGDPQIQVEWDNGRDAYYYPSNLEYIDEEACNGGGVDE